MTRLLLPLISLLLSACAQVEIPDITPFIVLPASGDCYGRSTVSDQVVRTVEGPLCEDKVKRSIHLTSDDWAKLKYTLLKNCLSNQCKQSVGALDQLFETIDNALKQLPKGIK